MPPPPSRSDAVSDQATPLLEARGVAKHFGPVVALRSADLSVSAGEVHALLGANGAGKSTLVKCLTGVTRPDAGTISVAGRDDARPLADARRTAWALAGLPGSGVRARPHGRSEPSPDRVVRRRGRLPARRDGPQGQFPRARRRPAPADPSHARPGARADARPAAADPGRDHGGPAVRSCGRVFDVMRERARAVDPCSSSRTASPR